VDNYNYLIYSVITVFTSVMLEIKHWYKRHKICSV